LVYFRQAFILLVLYKYLDEHEIPLYPKQYLQKCDFYLRKGCYIISSNTHKEDNSF